MGIGITNDNMKEKFAYISKVIVNMGDGVKANGVVNAMSEYNRNADILLQPLLDKLNADIDKAMGWD